MHYYYSERSLHSIADLPSISSRPRHLVINALKLCKREGSTIRHAIRNYCKDVSFYWRLEHIKQVASSNPLETIWHKDEHMWESNANCQEAWVLDRKRNDLYVEEEPWNRDPTIDVLATMVARNVRYLSSRLRTHTSTDAKHRPLLPMQSSAPKQQAWHIGSTISRERERERGREKERKPDYHPKCKTDAKVLAMTIFRRALLSLRVLQHANSRS